MTLHEGGHVSIEIPSKMPLDTLAVNESSRSARLESPGSSPEHLRAGSFLTESEIKSLREEMIRDGAQMKKWLAALQCDR